MEENQKPLAEKNTQPENYMAQSAENSASPDGRQVPTSEVLPSENEQHTGFTIGTGDKAIIEVSEMALKIKHEIQKVIIGQDETITYMLTALFSGGNLLLEGVPGVAKTLLVKLLAKTLDTSFKRIQFTPDLMPSDIIGTSIFDLKSSSFTFREGPLFSNFILVDEINRAPAKTQAALIEAMEERQVTVDGETYKLDFPLFIVATQNPIEQEGTYKLPEAQLDRFIFKLNVNYPDLEQEMEILTRFAGDFKLAQIDDVEKVFSVNDLNKCMAAIEDVQILPELIRYIASIVHNTRQNGDIFLGASTRASLAMLKASKALAAINGRNFVTPDDIKDVAYPVLNHRIILTPEREIEGVEIREVIDFIIEKIEVPR